MELDILIPVLGRPRNVTGLVESIKVTRTPHRVLFICSPGDDEQIEACLQSGHSTVVTSWRPGKADFAKKINWGFSLTSSPWVFQGADDIRFSPAWDVNALALARKRDKLVIGTNDLHNPQVKRGMQATHTLFARRYIEEQGGTHDNTGAIFHEGYDHQYVDLEFCETARRRGVWAYCKNSVVEHLHPHWGLAKDDPTYRKAMRSTLADRRRYMQRMGISSRSTAAERSRAKRLAR